MQLYIYIILKTEKITYNDGKPIEVDKGGRGQGELRKGF